MYFLLIQAQFFILFYSVLLYFLCTNYKYQTKFYFGFNRCFYDNSTQFDAKTIEDKMTTGWKNYFFHSNQIIEPILLPKCYWSLHMGHMLNNTIQDVLIRRARLKGFNACWVRYWSSSIARS
jgi:hypothetical protein